MNTALYSYSTHRDTEVQERRASVSAEHCLGARTLLQDFCFSQSVQEGSPYLLATPQGRGGVRSGPGIQDFRTTGAWAFKRQLDEGGG